MKLIKDAIEKYQKVIDVLKGKDIKRNYNESAGISGHLNIEHFDKDGNLLGTRSVKNLNPTIGLAECARLVGYDLSGTAFRYTQVGTGTTAAAAGDTDTETAVGAKVAAAVTNVTTTVTEDTIRFIATHSFSGSSAITEATITNNSSNGTGDLLARQVFSAINVNSGDSIKLTWDQKFAAA